MKEKIKQVTQKAASLLGYEIRKLRSIDHDRAVYISLYGQNAVDKRRFYTISAGGHFGFGGGIDHPLWTGIDVNKQWKTGRRFDPNRDIAHDLLSMAPIPIESKAAELVYSELCIEHITDDAALYMFKEVKRILKTGGVFRVVTPNIDLDYRAFCSNDRRYFFWMDQSISIEQCFLFHFAAYASELNKGDHINIISDRDFRKIFSTMSFEKAMNHCTSMCPIQLHMNRRENHINWWNANKLGQYLNEAGFKNVHLSGAGQSSVPVLRNLQQFDKNYSNVMLFMEAM